MVPPGLPVFLFSTSLFFAACASQTDVLPLGPDTFTVSVGAVGTGSKSGNDTQAKQQALVQANAYCVTKGKQILVQQMSMKSTMWGSTSEIVFQCLDANDPLLKTRPVYRKDADVIIENRSN